jgi:hypothetical protein
LPKKFLVEYLKNHRFHDCELEDIRVTRFANNIFNVLLQVSGIENISYIITLRKARRLYLNIPEEKAPWTGGVLTWQYSEFELKKDGTWILRILCDNVCEMEFHFTNIRIQKLKIDEV